MNEQLLLYVCIVAAVTAFGFFLSRLFVTGDNTKQLRQRLTEAGTNSTTAEQDQQAIEDARGATGKVASAVQKLGSAAAQPFMPNTREKQSTIRKQLAQAGIYSASAIRVMTGAKVILMAGGVGLGYAMGVWTEQVMLGVSLGGLVGYFLPRMWLKQKVKANQRALSLGLPDALDLMVVCVEAGLTVDDAMQRIGIELQIAHPAISREFGIARMETRVGLSRAESLKNLYVRTGSASLQSLSTMLIQADRFGTSIAAALRIQAESLRTKRQHAAEELAAKASVKMSFPLVLFIFPATFIVLAGPTVIGLMKSALFTE